MIAIEKQIALKKFVRNKLKSNHDNWENQRCLFDMYHTCRQSHLACKSNCHWLFHIPHLLNHQDYMHTLKKNKVLTFKRKMNHQFRQTVLTGWKIEEAWLTCITLVANNIWRTFTTFYSDISLFAIANTVVFSAFRTSWTVRVTNTFWDRKTL